MVRPGKTETVEISEEPYISEAPDAVPYRHIFQPAIIVARRKSFIWRFVLIVAVLSAGISLLLPKYFTATTKMLPPQQNQSIATALLGQLGPLAGFAGGKDLGIRSPNDMYMSMLRSRTVADSLIDRFSLMGLYREEKRIDARTKLADRTEITSGRDGIIVISVADRDPVRAANMANAYVEELEKLTRTLAVTDAGKKRLFFEQEVKTASDDLARAEDELKATQETTGIIQLDSQAKVMLQAYADLRAQVSAKEVQVQAMQTFATPGNPDLIRSQQELAALRVQVAHFEQGQSGRSMALEKVPRAGLDYLRRLREVKYRETLFELLAKQYEIARIDEAEGAGLVQVLDRALPPEKKSWPPRAALVLVATLLALMVGAAIVFVQESFRRAKETPQFAEQLALLKSYLVRQVKSTRSN